MDDEKTENIIQPSTSQSGETPTKDNIEKEQDSSCTSLSRYLDNVTSANAIVVHQRARANQDLKTYGAQRGRKTKNRFAKLQKKRQVNIKYTHRKAPTRRGNERDENINQPSTSATYRENDSTSTVSETSSKQEPKIDQELPPVDSQNKRKSRRSDRLANKRREMKRAIDDKSKQSPIKRKRNKRNPSIHTILSSRSGSLCEFCGQNCCRRYRVKQRNRSPLGRRRMYRGIKNSEGIQVGTPTMTLSPLLLAENSPPGEQAAQILTHCEVTPEMLHAALRQLTMWRHQVPTERILDYIVKNYPVNPDRQALMEELLEKLRVASSIGMVTSNNNTWGPGHSFQRRLSLTHVSVFWKVYGDTMKPVTKKVEQEKENTEEKQKTEQNKVDVQDDQNYI